MLAPASLLKWSLMRRRLVITLLVSFATTLGGLPAVAATPPPPPESGDGLDPTLREGLEDGTIDRIVVDLVGAADVDAAARGHEGEDRSDAVIGALQAEHGRSAPGVIMQAQRAGADAHGYWLTNAVVIEGATADLAEALARRDDVAAVRAERVYPLVEPVETAAVIEAAIGGDPTWGVSRIGADAAWSTGVLGSGIVVANVDTGVDYLHESLVAQYRGNNHDGTFTHDHNWWDPSRICGNVPCDNAGHGTHTMGTMVGGDGPGPFVPDIGVAPGATWIAAKGCEDFYCTESSLLSSGQWILAPTDSNGLNPDPSRRPDIVNNSWGSGPGDEFYAETVAAWRAAGIIPVFSSGNPGPRCGDGGSPGDFVDVISAGATDVNDLIAPFSGRGPSVFGKVNPDITAPGVDVTSAVPGGYASYSGTSMAAPHTAGALALILSAEPALIGDFDGAVDALKSTALDILDGTCGGDDDLDPNNVYGDGRIDAAAAVALVATGGTLTGTLTDDATTDPIAGGTVTAISTDTARSFRATTEADGSYRLFLAAGTYDVTGSAFAYADATATSVVIVTDETTVQDLALTALPRYDVSGIVSQAEDGDPLAGATVTALATPLAPAVSDGAGLYTLSLPAGQWTLRAAAGGCTDVVDVVVEVVDAPVSQDILLARKLDGFGHVCRPVAFDWVDAANESSLAGDDTYGRFTLPFTFDFYGTSYGRVFITTNGYLTFTDPKYADPLPVRPPTTFNKAPSIFALWQDFRLDDTSHIDTEVIGSAPDRAFVIEMEDLLYSGKRVDVEVKLWEDGTIDLLYGDNPPAADGRFGVVGLQNATGSDAFVFSAFERVIPRSSAYRFEVADVATISGTITDANDGLPVTTATVTAVPGLQSATSLTAGDYSLNVLPGTYEIRFVAPGYVTHVEALTVAAGDLVSLDAVLAGPVAGLAPDAIDVNHAVRQVTTRTVTIANTGTAPLTWELRERRMPTTPTPPAPAAELFGIRRTPEWGRGPEGPAPTTAAPDVNASDLEVIIDDPLGDASGVDVDDVLGGSDGVDVNLALRMASAADAQNTVGYVFLDIDQDADTGVAPWEWGGNENQDIGADVILDLFSVPFDGMAYLIDPVAFDYFGAVEATISGADMTFAIPLDLLFGDDGAIDVAAVVGDYYQPTDWAPDAGHGTIEPFTDLPWLTPDVAAGVLAAGDTIDVDVRIGTEDLQPGDYAGLLVLASDAPRQPRLDLPVSLTIPLPATWGTVSGTVSDIRTGAPLDAAISVATIHDGSPFNVEVEADGGAFQFFAPAGTWPMAVRNPGYEDLNRNVTVRAGRTTNLALELVPTTPQASIDVTGFEPFVEVGGRQSTTITLTNSGPVPLTFGSGEVDLGHSPAGSGQAGAPARSEVTRPADGQVNATTTRDLGRPATQPAAGIQAVGDVLASWPTFLDLPWGVAYDGDVILSDPFARIDARFTTAGERTGEFETPWAGDFAADMAYDEVRGWIWQVNVGGDNGLYGLDPTTGAVMATVTGSPWSSVSQRGVAHDPDTDTFYVGGWNDGIVYRVAGPSWPTPGATLSQCAPDDPDIAGLAYNRAFGALWMTTNSASDTIWLIDATTCAAGYTLPFPDGGGYVGAGVEIDVVGNLWVASQLGDAYLIDSGLPLFTEVPWLSATPTDGVVPPGQSTTITLTADATGLDLGTYEALFVLTTDDPLASAVPVPVMLTVAPDVPGDDIVTVTTVSNAAEPGTDGLVRVTRNEAFGALDVQLTSGGTATPGQDVEPLPDTVSFADGETSVDVPVVVLDDAIPEGVETVTIAVMASPDYVVGTADLAVVSVLDDEAPLRPGVTRLSGPTRYDTAVAVSQDSFPDPGSAGAVVLARGDAFPDGLAGGPLARMVNGPLLLTRPSSLGAETATEIQRVLAAGGTVHVLGGEQAISADVAGELEGLGFVVDRVAGATRYDTAVAIAEMVADPSMVVVAVGTNFPDALTASTAAATLGGVVVFSGADEAVGVTDAYLAAHPTTPRYALGGPAARAYPSLGPIVGSDRYETASMVAAKFFPAPYAIGLARGDDFADALTGGVHAAQRAAPMLLTPTAELRGVVTDYVAAHGGNLIAVYLYGGEQALSAVVAAQARGFLK